MEQAYRLSFAIPRARQMMIPAKNILFLCTGNSARSVIAEGILRHRGAGRYCGFSAGSMPTGKPNPFALRVLERHGIEASFARSKSWDEFAGPQARMMHIIITVCDNAAGENCPIWPGMPVSAHWGVADPAAVTGSDEKIAAAFEVTYSQMCRRIESLLALGDLNETSLQAALAEIGDMD
jgi:protein-tyrosine-phosphatase